MGKKLTGWFAKGVKPARIGVYEVDDDDGLPGYFAWWSGKRFAYRSESAQLAFLEKDFRTSCAPLVKWRGLARRPR